ncbi:MAG: chorismate-binding protein [Leptospiraceae bacterium]|nr:chorismate-binding protein [Leptospiraceae bacterium]
MIRFLFYGQDGQDSRFLRAYIHPVYSLRLNAHPSQDSDPDLRETILQNLQTIDQWKQSLHVVCLFSYEMGCILHNANQPASLPVGYPLMAAYAFPGATMEEREAIHEDGGGENSKQGYCPAFALGPARSVLAADYRRNIESIQEAIRSGRTYQVNFTHPVHMPFSGSPLAFFHHLRKRYPSPYSVYAELEDRHIISISPELFFLSKPVAPDAAASAESSPPGSGGMRSGRSTGADDNDRATSYRIEVRPMKGTVRASSNPDENRRLKQQLLESEKDRAELAMITDLLRNDLGRICPPGGVRLEKAIQPESYVYVHQLTSVIVGERSNDSLKEIIPFLFPSGSITGAPRRETMQIIAERECDYRGIYTGSIGYCLPSADKNETGHPPGFPQSQDSQDSQDSSGSPESPGKENPGVSPDPSGANQIEKKQNSLISYQNSDHGFAEPIMVFNVAIRTAEILRGMLRYGAGGGITLLSEPDLEWKELHWKAKPVLTQNKPGLIETMALQRGRIRNEDLHVRRLLRSARRLSIPLSKESLEHDLQTLKQDYPKGKFRVRLHLTADGQLEKKVAAMQMRADADRLLSSEEQTVELSEERGMVPPKIKMPRPRKRKWKLRLIADPVSSKDPWLLHKVDRREIYDRTLDSVRQAGYDEALFINQDQEITEGAISSIFYRWKGAWYTPPVRCGLLPGVGRQRLLARGKGRIAFRRLKVHELDQVERIVLINSLRGLHEGELEL